MEPTDRRWFVVFTPWGSLEEMWRYCGVDAAGWKAFGERLQKAGAPYKAAGYGFGWHNHDFEFKALAEILNVDVRWLLGQI